MKKLKIIGHSLQILFPAIVTAFLISSCNKDELFPASPPASANDRQAVAVPTALPYQVIKINHLAGRGPLPDYEVVVNSDLNASFEGRRNTAFTGIKNFKIDEITFSMLKELFISSHLFDVPPQTGGDANNTELADVPEVFTSFNKNGSHEVTRKDYNNPDAMPELFRLRTHAESLLNIGYLINGK